MKIPYRYRGLVRLVVLLVVLPGAAWLSALRESCAVWRDCRRLDRALAATDFRAAGAEQAEPFSAACPELILSGGLLDSVRRYAPSDVRTTGYLPVVTLREAGICVHTAQITLTGTHADLLRTLHRLEQRLTTCRVRSAEWRTTLRPRTRQRQLLLTLYVQQPYLIPNEHE